MATLHRLLVRSTGVSTSLVMLCSVAAATASRAASMIASTTYLLMSILLFCFGGADQCLLDVVDLDLEMLRHCYSPVMMTPGWAAENLTPGWAAENLTPGVVDSIMTVNLPLITAKTTAPTDWPWARL